MFNPNHMPNLIFHLTVVATGIAATVWVNKLYPEHYRLYFLTNWSLFIQTFTSFIFAFKDFLRIVGLINSHEDDLQVESKKKATLWTQLHFALFHVSVVFPIMVVVMFWGIFCIDRRYLGPAGLDEFPLALNHMLHTSPGIVAVLEVLLYIMLESKGMYLSRDGHAAAKKTGTLATFIIILAYGLMILTVNRSTGNWPYPFLGTFSIFQLFIFLLGVLVTFILVSRSVNSFCSCICKSVYCRKQSGKSS